jgi:hypothetical protein
MATTQTAGALAAQAEGPAPAAQRAKRYGESPAWATPAQGTAATPTPQWQPMLAGEEVADSSRRGGGSGALTTHGLRVKPPTAAAAASSYGGGGGNEQWAAPAAARAPGAMARKRTAASAFEPPAPVIHGAVFTAGASAASRAFLAARASIKDTRNAKVSIAQAGLDKMCRALTGDEVAAAVRSAVISVSAGAPKNAGRLKAFVAFMETKFPFLEPLPVRLEGVMVYCTEHVVVGGYMSAYLSDIVSQLRVATRALGLWGLDAQDEAHLLAVNKFLQRSFPCESAPQPTLTVEQLARLYTFLDTLDCVEARLCSALVKMMVCMQARAAELLDGALWAGDIAFHQFGVLINSVLNKCRKATLNPTARVAPRLPEHMKLHDVFYSLQQHLFRDAGWAHAAPAANTPVFLQPRLAANGKYELSSVALSAINGRNIILKYLRLAGMAEHTAAFSFSLHFGRGAGFNLLHNSLYVERALCAAAGGWRHGDVIDKHYHTRSPLELAVNLRLAFVRLAPLLKWKLL